MLFLAILLCSGCKKALEQMAQNAIVNAMTDGYWVVTSFKQNGADITSDFTGYQFKYYSNKTVDAIQNGVVQQTGNWDGNVSAKTTWANFPGATVPLSLLDGTWNITNNTWTYVIATQTSGTDVKSMRLDKK